MTRLAGFLACGNARNKIFLRNARAFPPRFMIKAAVTSCERFPVTVAGQPMISHRSLSPGSFIACRHRNV